MPTLNDIKNNRGVKKLQEAWNDNPILVLGVGAATVTAVAKLTDAVSAAQGRRAYSKQINHKVKMQQRQQF